jgi:hypothetical protein
MATTKKTGRKKTNGKKHWKTFLNNFDFELPDSTKGAKTFALDYDVSIQFANRDSYRHGKITLGKYFVTHKLKYKTLSIGVSKTGKKELLFAFDNDYYKDSIAMSPGAKGARQYIANMGLVAYIFDQLEIAPPAKGKVITLHFEVQEAQVKNMYILKPLKL